MKRLIMGGMTLLTAAILAACGAPSAGTGTGASATTTGTGASATTTGTGASATTTGTTGGTSATGNTIVDVAGQQGTFTTLLTALKVTGLDKTLSQAGEYTVFAPTDAAFAALPAATLQALLADPATLTKILSYHVVSGNVMAADVATSTSLTSLEGQPIQVTASGSTVKLNGDTTVTATDVATSNGVIHVIDKVLLPPDVPLPSGS